MKGSEGSGFRKQLPLPEQKGQGRKLERLKLSRNSDEGPDGAETQTWGGWCAAWLALATLGGFFRLGSNFYLRLSRVCCFTPLTNQPAGFPPRAHTGFAAGPGHGQADLPPGLLTQQIQGHAECWWQVRMQPPRGDSAQTCRVWEQILLSSADNYSPFEKLLVTGPS